MRTIIFRLIAIALTLISVIATADELTDYVQKCESELGFVANDVPSLDCNDGLAFDIELQGSPINDFTGHAAINSQVDLVFSCRWLVNAKPAYSPTATSVELIMHNRQNGATCFFAAKDFSNPSPDIDTVVSTTIVSPTDANASSYWMQPTEIENKRFTTPGSKLNTHLACVGCHVAGPYIASNNIAPFLAQFGLLNDGHDTFGAGNVNGYHVVTPTLPDAHGQTAFARWNQEIRDQNSTTGLAACASSCHSIGTKSTVGTIYGAQGVFPVIPSLLENITGLIPEMPPGYPANSALLERSLNYTWVNMTNPSTNSTGEIETLEQLRNWYPAFYCPQPAFLVAHVVDSYFIFGSGSFPDKLNRFNLQDGLVCLNGDQNGSTCHDYQTRYKCGGWTAWKNQDDPGYSGDWETRSGAGVCASPTGIQARYNAGSAKSPNWIIANGPPDRLDEFDSNGLVCYNAQQSNNKCSNYVVRFECPK